MPTHSLSPLLVALIAPILLGSVADSIAAGDSPIWDLEGLEKAPEFRWLDDQSPIRSLLYQSEPYQGHPTEVFAFYASPATIDRKHEGEAGEKYPGVVLIHGGGGTAFAEWVQLWAKRGYAAIAMDLSGHRPPAPEFDEKGDLKLPDRGNDRDARIPLENAGPDQGHEEKFQSIGGDVSDDWPRFAVASAIRAHSLLRSFPEVDPDRTAVTGISWGGYTTCLVASVDSRFKAAVPVYGCGFLFEGESVQKKSIDALEPDLRSEWIRRYDPSSHLAKCQVPILFVNGSHDIHYPLDSYEKCFQLVPAEKQMRIEFRMRHGHFPGWAPKEIGIFIDAHCRGGKPLPHPGEPKIDDDGNVRVKVEHPFPLKEATLYYTTETGLRSDREWQKVPARIEADSVVAPAPPAEANTWYLSVTDERDAMVSTEVQFSPPLK
ncbi:MAG: prolyl oligopeptidase family serine peptidase [Verrucomicrobiae bacterium]|nr:prolyl oligopeptidase family serine peptidase [Verrucomicrobiae bacterium]